MDIKFKGTPNIAKIMERKIAERIEKLKGILIEIGQEAVKIAKEQGSYNDQTTDLRNSNGFVIVLDGVIVHREFSNGEAGSKGFKAAQTLALNHPEGLALIFTNGMEYAAEVESRGYDVITSAHQLVKRIAPIKLGK